MGSSSVSELIEQCANAQDLDSRDELSHTKTEDLLAWLPHADDEQSHSCFADTCGRYRRVLGVAWKRQGDISP